MKASENNIETLMLVIHQKIEEYADFLASRIEEGNPIEHVTYPPNNGFTDKEIESLHFLKNKPELKSAIRKLVADNIAGVFFDFFNFIDGTSDPNPELGEWTELAFVDKENSVEPPIEMLHDKLYGSYWEWRKIRKGKDWKLDIYEE
jgi:hypothetical protein